MKYLRFFAIFLAFGFVTYQIINLNSKVREESAMSSLIEIYKVTSNARLSLRKGPSGESEILMRLDGRDSGNPAKVLVVSKADADWWKIQYTDDEEKVMVGYASSDFLELDQTVEAFSLVWNEVEKTFVEQDTKVCEKKQVDFEKSELSALNFGEALFRNVDVKDESEKMVIFSGALLKATSTAGEYKVLSNPSLIEDSKTKLAPVDSIVIVAESNLASLKDKVVRVPELDKYIEDTSSIAETFEFESQNKSMTVYNCCFEGKACQDYAQLKPRNDALKEVLMVPYEGTSVYKKLQALEEVVAKSEEENSDESDKPSNEGSLDAAETTRNHKYTNYEDYFLGPKGVNGRHGGDVYRLNVKSGGGRVKNGPCGSYHYNPENFGGLVGGDRYIKKEILGCFLATLQVFKREHPNARVQWGDISRGDRTSFRPDHSTHTDGRDVDVRPIRADSKLLSCNIGSKGTAGCYSRRLTQAFINIAMRFGGDPVYFNDRNVNKRSSKIKFSKGHYDHFHIRYSRTCTGITLDTKYCPTEGFN